MRDNNQTYELQRDHERPDTARRFRGRPFGLDSQSDQDDDLPQDPQRPAEAA